MHFHSLQLLLILAVFFSSQVGHAQNTFQKTYDFGNYEGCSSVLQTDEGEYIMLGESTGTNSLNDYKLLLVKTDGFGDIVWSKKYGGIKRDEGSAIVQARDGGFLLLGNTSSFGDGEENIFLVKVDSDGNQVWQKTFGHTGKNRGIDIIPNRHGGYVFTGVMQTTTGLGDLVITAIDESGNLSWQHTYGGSGYERGMQIIQSYDGGFMICGSTRASREKKDNSYLVKTNTKGILQWARIYKNNESEGAFSVRQTSDGNYIVCGYTFCPESNQPGSYLMKVDTTGNPLWTRCFKSQLWDLAVHDDGCYVGLGYRKKTDSSAAKGNDAYLLKISPVGDSLWSANFGNTKHESVYSFCRSKDGAYAMVGSSYSQTANQGQADGVLFIKTFVPTDLTLKSQIKSGLFPNPNNGNFQVICSAPFQRIEVFDSSGKLVYSKNQVSSNLQPSAEVLISSLKRGLYYARIQTAAGFENQSFVVY